MIESSPERKRLDNALESAGIAAATDAKERQLAQRRDVVHIGKRSRWQLLDVRDLLRYRDLLFFLVKRDLHVVYKQTVLGFGWAVIQPLLSMVVFTVVFGRMAQMPTNGVPYPIFSFAALVPWIYFSSSVDSSTRSLVSQANIITKVYFPRVFIPFTSVLAKGVNFGISIIVLVLMMVAYQVELTGSIVLFPLFVVLLVLTALGFGLWLSALAVQYRDLIYVTNFMMQILMYAAPVVWPVSLVPDQYRLIYGLYPMAGIIGGFRACLLGGPVPWDLVALGSVSTAAILVSGLWFFRRVEATFADVV